MTLVDAIREAIRELRKGTEPVHPQAVAALLEAVLLQAKDR